MGCQSWGPVCNPSQVPSPSSPRFRWCSATTTPGAFQVMRHWGFWRPTRHCWSWVRGRATGPPCWSRGVGWMWWRWRWPKSVLNSFDFGEIAYRWAFKSSIDGGFSMSMFCQVFICWSFASHAMVIPRGFILDRIALGSGNQDGGRQHGWPTNHCIRINFSAFRIVGKSICHDQRKFRGRNFRVTDF